MYGVDKLFKIRLKTSLDNTIDFDNYMTSSQMLKRYASMQQQKLKSKWRFTLK